MALDATWQRNKAISENIANIDTPGYKRQDVSFEEQMSKALKKNRTDVTELERVQPRQYTVNSGLSYRLDGNNVDIDTEMVSLAENQLRYNTLTSQVNYNFERLKNVLR